MQETLAHLFFWGHCPSLSSPLSFAPQGCSLSALTDHCRVSPPQVQDVPTLLPISWQVAGWRRERCQRGSQQQQGSSRALTPCPISRDVTNPLGQEPCLGAQAGTGRAALGPTALWGAAGAGNRSPHLHPARTVFVLPGKGESLLRKKGIYPLLGV